MKQRTLKRRNAGVSVNYTTAEERAGTHNRKARRVAKANARKAEMFEQPPFDEARWRSNYEQRREQRRAYWASKTDADIQDMALAESGAVAWDPLLLGLLFVAIPLWVHRHYRTTPSDREQRAHHLGTEIVCASQGIAAICDPDARGTETKGGITEAFNAIAEGLGIGAYCPGGATFGGLNWAVVGTQLRITNRAFCAIYPLDDPSYWEEPAAA